MARSFSISKPDDTELSEIELALLNHSAIHHKIPLKHNLPAGTLVSYQGRAYLIDRFDQHFHLGTDSSSLNLIDLGKDQEASWVELAINTPELSSMMESNRGRSSPLFARVEDLVDKRVLGAYLPTSEQLLRIFESSRSVFKADKTRHEQYMTGLIGFDWTNPIFYGSFTHLYSRSLDVFKHEFSSLLVRGHQSAEYKLVYFGLHEASQNSLKKHLGERAETGLPDSLFLSLETGVGGSEKVSKMRLMFRSVLTVLRDLKRSGNVLFLLDDVNLMHKETIGAFGDSGHQVYIIG